MRRRQDAKDRTSVRRRHGPLRVRVLVLAAAAILGASALPAQDLLRQARATAERGAMDSAYTLLLRAVEREPMRAEGHFWLAQVSGTLAAEHRNLSSYGLARRAKRAFGRAVQLEPDNPLYLEGLGRYLSAAPGIVGGDRDSARAVGQRLLGLDPMRGTFLLVGLLRRGNERDRARSDSLVEVFARSGGGGREGQVRLASYYSQSGRADRALPIAERLVTADSTDAVARYALGRILVTLRRDPQTAARHLRYAVAHPPPVTTDGRQYWPAGVWFRLGQAYVQLSQPDSARAAFRQALRLDDGFRPARQALDSLARRR